MAEKTEVSINQAPDFINTQKDMPILENGTQEKSAFQIDGEICGSFLDAVFSIAASKGGDHWKLSTGEKKSLGEATAAVLNKYLPDYIKTYPELFAFAITASIIVIPRVQESMANRKKAEPKTEKIEAENVAA